MQLHDAEKFYNIMGHTETYFSKENLKVSHWVFLQ